MDKEVRANLKDLAGFSSKQDLHIVGGTLRDHFLGIESADWDFSARDAPRVARLFSAHVKGHLVRLDETPGRETYRVVTRKTSFFDFSETQGGSIEQDLAHRDFTINAMAVPLTEFLKTHWRVLDPFHGLADLKNKIVRALPGPTFEADPLRIIRAFRFSSILGFEIEKQTIAKIKQSAVDLGGVAGERISHELSLFLDSKNAFPCIQLMDETGTLERIIPEIGALRNRRGGEPEKTAWQESLDTFEALERILSRPQKPFPQGFSGLEKFLEKTKLSPLKLAALLFRLDGEQKPRPVAGRKDPNMSPNETILKRLRFSNADILFILKVIEFQKTADSTRLNFAETSDYSRMYSCAKESGNELVPALLLAAANCPRSGRQEETAFTQALRNLLEFYLQRFLPAQTKPALLTGDDLIRQFDLSPSPLFKTILSRVEEARVLGTVATRKEAEALARNLIESP